MDLDSMENMPNPGDGTTYHFVDLYGEGNPGILIEMGHSNWFYKPALGGGRYGPAEKLPMKPSNVILMSSQIDQIARFADIDGDGVVELVHFDSVMPGYSRKKA